MNEKGKRENIPQSTALTQKFIKVCQTVQDLCRENLEKEEIAISDELSLCIVELHEGMVAIGENFHDCLNLLAERQSYLGDEGLELQFEVRFDDEDDEEKDYYNDD